MGCPKNPKKFLRIIPYEGAHDLRLVQLEYYGSGGRLFFECGRCGTQEKRYLYDEELVRQGFDVKKLREAKDAMLADAKLPEFPRNEIDQFRETPYAD
jgi:hypothetical protein